MKKLLRLSCFALVVALLLSATACGLPGATAVHASSGSLSPDGSAPMPDAAGTAALNRFAFDLYGKLAQGGNVFLSPASLFLALGMTYNGATGRTAEEMAEVLHVEGMDLAAFNAYSRSLQLSLVNGAFYRIANSVWIRSDFQDAVRADFLQRNRESFGTAVYALDFSKDASRDTINQWVSSNTGGRIKTAIDEPISPLTVMFLLDTILFTSDWKDLFATDQTTDATFRSPLGDEPVRMMHRTGPMQYYEDESLQAVTLPYADGRTSLVVLLPRTLLDADFRATLDASRMQAVLDGMKGVSEVTALSLPKVSIAVDTQMNGPLMELGMALAFGNADFSGISDQAVDRGLYIAEVLHKTTLDIHEKGTEAAAMTKVEIKEKSAPTVMNTMVVDRPFVLAIVDEPTDAVIFLGEIAQP